MIQFHFFIPAFASSLDVWSVAREPNISLLICSPHQARNLELQMMITENFISIPKIRT